MTTYGVTSEGFVIKPLDVILTEIQQDQLDDISQSLDHSAETPLGQMNGIFAEPIAELWEVAAAMYSILDPNTSVDTMLNNICALTGVTRLAASYSTVTVICAGTIDTVLDAGQILKVSSALDKFESMASATLAAADAWAISTAYEVGDVVTNDDKIYYCSDDGTSAGSGGPIGTGTAITDNTVTWRYCGENDGYAEVTFQAQETGPVAANAWTLTEIETSVSGWENATNPLDAELGRNQETNSELRARREESLAIQGAGTVEAITSDVRAVENVISVTVFENTTDLIDDNSLPPHSVEVLVLGGDDDEIAQAIWDSVAGGIEPHGDDSGTAVDENGDNQTVYFTRPTEKTIYVTVDVTTNDDYPTDGDTQIKTAIVTKGETLGSGADVIEAALFGPTFGITGVVDVTSIKLDFTSSPSASDNLEISDREISTWDTSRITVNAT